MRITADFTVIPDVFAKAADPEHKTAGTPVVSFPFYIEDFDKSRIKYLHWEFLDPDSIPVCGFEWIHWSAANLPVDALMFDFNDSRALQIPPDFSRQMAAMIPEAVQGRTSAASRFVGETDPSVTMRYNGPNPPDKDHEYYLHVWGTSKPLPGLNQGFWLNELQHASVTMRYNGPNPPDKDHEYYLHVWGTSKPLPGLNQGFWLNELQHAIRDCGETPDQGGIFLTGNHEYYLHVWGTSKPLPGLNQGFWLNELQHAIRDCGETPDQGGIFLTGRA